jgi:hypothetical protein
MAILVRVNAWVNSIIIDTGAAAAGVNEIYLRPGGVDEYRRPGGTDSYLRP